MGLREANRQVVKAYLEIEGNAVEQRMALFHPEIMYEIVHTMECRPERTCGKEKVRERFLKNAKHWKDFCYSRVKLWACDDPNVFIAECDGTAEIISPMFTKPRPYKNYYYIMFVMRDGAIWQLRQFTNPMKLIHDFWCEMPDVCK